MSDCERCQKPAPAGFNLFDYCATCNKNLCPDCMTKGCCGREPAESGMEMDDQPEEDN